MPLTRPKKLLAGNISSGTIPANVIASSNVGFLRQYTGKNTTSVSKSTTVISLMTIPNVVVNSGEEVFLAYHISMLNTSNSQMHCGIVPHYSGSATGYVGDGSWGIGIHDMSSHHQWNMLTGFVNLSQYRTGGGGPFASTGTFTFDIRARSTNTSGYWGSEGNGTSVSYTPNQCTILIAAADAA